MFAENRTYNCHMTKNLHESDGQVGIIFIHGAGLSGWIWDDVIANISCPHVCADYSSLERVNNMATLNDYVEVARLQVEQLNTKRVAIVAHSIGGVVGVELSSKLGNRLAAYVGVSAVIPKPGGSFMTSLPFPQKMIMPIIFKLAGTKPPESAIRSGLGNGLPLEETNEIVAKFQQESSHLYTDRISKTLPSNVHGMYLRTTQDKELSLQIQNESIARLNNPDVYDIDSGHMPMLSDTDVLAEYINKLMLKV